MIESNQEKSFLRNKFKSDYKTFVESSEHNNRNIAKNLFSFLEKTRGLQKTIHIFYYHPFKSEVNILKYFRLKSRFKIYFPNIIGNSMIFMNKEKTLIRNKADIVIVPGLFFNQAGYRLGRGGGYYDRFLRFIKPDNIVSLAYNWQKVDAIPTNQYDRKINVLITETSWSFSRNKPIL